ncbi:hypothetical protein K5M35_02960, partial [Chromobacterium vaccinii]|nr:hypothetical protein [Chromobacterium vaccinii]
LDENGHANKPYSMQNHCWPIPALLSLLDAWRHCAPPHIKKVRQRMERGFASRLEQDRMVRIAGCSRLFHGQLDGFVITVAASQIYGFRELGPIPLAAAP